MTIRFTDEGYIIGARKHGESSLVLSLLTRGHGRLTGFARHCLSRKSLPTYQTGNLVKIDAYARVEENMPSLRIELISPTAAKFLGDSHKLTALSSLCALADACLPQSEPLEALYGYIDSFFKQIDQPNWLARYAFFEYRLLEYLGIGLDLSACAATGQTEDLAYVSPKTGKAVGREAGEPYHDKLFAFPHCVVDKNPAPQPEEVAELLRLSGYFLQKNFFQTHHLKFPSARANLLIEGKK